MIGTRSQGVQTLLTRILAPLALAISPAASCLAQEADERSRGSEGPLETVTVIGITPYRGLDLPADMIPGHIQTSTSAEIQRLHGTDLGAFMNRRLGSVFINDAQGSPMQPDVQFRGFVASPLLGQPQGI
mgnify:CR=1 FL=1